jgi:hypothetical protein
MPAETKSTLPVDTETRHREKVLFISVIVPARNEAAHTQHSLNRVVDSLPFPIALTV